MPIHLGPITRRDFLTGAAGATAALVIGRRAYAAEAVKVDPNCFALLSDTHVPADPKTNIGRVNMTKQFARTIAQVAELTPAPSGAILCGDLSHVRGLVGDYRIFAPIVGKLAGAKIPAHLLLGNHDNIKNLYSVLAKAKPKTPPVAGKHVSIVQSPHANWFLLDSLEKTNSTPGRLGKEQLEWLTKSLDAHSDKPAIIMAHHDPSLAPRPKKGAKKRKTSGLQDGAAMLDILLERKHVKAFINGHRHSWSVRKHKGLHVIGLPTTAYSFGKNASGWVIARTEKTGMSLEFRTTNAKHADNGKKAKLTW